MTQMAFENHSRFVIEPTLLIKYTLMHTHAHLIQPVLTYRQYLCKNSLAKPYVSICMLALMS